LQELISVVEEAGIEIDDAVAAPVAASLVTLSKQQKTAGCLLANIGSETVSIAVFENNIPASLEVFPIGSTDITNDIALGLKVSLEEAEKLKLGGMLDQNHSRKKLDEIILARLSDIFELIEAHLKKIGRNGLLPAGIIITGGGSGISTIEDFAKAALRLPSRIGNIAFGPTLGDRFKDATWSVAYGLCILGLSGESDGIKGSNEFGGKDMAKQVGRWLKQFLP
jgi:cell division protein FtsA